MKFSYDASLYYIFDTDTTAWRDNLVAEELLARLPAILFASCGTLTTDSTDSCGKIKKLTLNIFNS